MRRLQIHEESSTGTADDLNAFRRQVSSIFGSFSAREGAITNSFAYIVFSRLQGTAANVTCTSYKSLGCHASQGEVISVVGSSGSHGSWQSEKKKLQIMLELVKEGFIHQVDIRYFQHHWVKLCTCTCQSATMNKCECTRAFFFTWDRRLTGSPQGSRKENSFCF